MRKLLIGTTFVFCLAIISALHSHNPVIYTFDHNPFNEFCESTNPVISCNISGWKFNKTHYYNSDGTLLKVAWHNDPRAPILKLRGEGHGLGYAQIQFWGNTDGTNVGNRLNKSRPIRIGTKTPCIPFAFYSHEVDISLKLRGKFKYEVGKRSWDGSGVIHITPYYYRISTGFPPSISGTWVPGATSTITNSYNNYWTIKHLHLFLQNESQIPCDDCDGTGCSSCN